MKKTSVTLLFVLTLIYTSASQALLRIEITEGMEGAEPIAIVPFGWGDAKPLPEDLAQIVSADLHRSARFSPMKPEDMLAKPTAMSQIKYQNWRIMEIPYLVIGSVQKLPNGKYRVVSRLFDVYREKELKGGSTELIGNSKQLRKMAHMISDRVYQELTGERGAFDTRLAYVRKVPGKGKKTSRYLLCLSDSDSYNERVVINSKSPLISPAWSPDGKQVAFVAVGNNGQGIVLYDETAKEGKGDFIRLTQYRDKFSAPSWSPDGKKMAAMGLKSGSADLFIIDLDTKRRTKITRHWAIDAEPAWAPDGKSIVFSSDRGGTPQLYQYFINTRKIRRLTFEGRQNQRASFSPDGTMITFVHLDARGDYNIAVMEMETLQMRLVTKPSHEETLHESPSFAPNGSMIIYAATHKGQNGVLAAVSVDGRVHQRFSDAKGTGEVREPAWSSFLN